MRIPILQNRKPDEQSEKTDLARTPCNDVKLTLSSVLASNGGPALLAQIQTPRTPKDDTHHVPCDIVLVIDVSGSMGAYAPVPGEDDKESTGLSVLDVVKHAALTIIETLDERDRLGIVTFASSIEVLQNLEVMTEEKKEIARKNIKGMRPKDATNLWQGIVRGLKLFEKTPSNGKVPAVMVLTDGMPNHMCPPKGYVPKLRTMMPLPASIHTFGFGYHLRSGLLKSIAEIGNGNYAFIPDAGMIGTVFVHAVANLQTTFATEATLQLKYAAPLEIQETTGDSVASQSPKQIDNGGNTIQELAIQLGNLQYGQSRDVFLRLGNVANIAELNKSGITGTTIIEATITFKPVEYRQTAAVLDYVVEQHNIFNSLNLTNDTVSYHESRSLICTFLASLFPINSEGEHCAVQGDDLDVKMLELKALIENNPSNGRTDALNLSLMEDLAGKEPKGQISIAILQRDQFYRWGQHFLPSLLNAHTRQICNSFKDSGPLQYGFDSPLFIACRDRLDTAFDNLPPPEPTVDAGYGRGGHYSSSAGGASRSKKISSMKMFRNAAGPCFAASTTVELASGRTVEIKRLRRGMKVKTLLGSRKVVGVLKTPVRDAVLCRMGQVLVTPWHPMSIDGKSWTFPADTADKVVRYTGCIYSIVLQMDRDPDAHALHFGGVWGVTLGHGITSGADGRAHSFLGDYSLIAKSLMMLGMDGRGVAIGGGIQRDAQTGLICGFSRPERSKLTLTLPIRSSIRGKQILRA